MLDGGKVGGCVLGSDPAFVVAKDHVHDPVEAVLDRPVAPHNRSQLVGWEHERGEVEAGFLLDPACGLPGAMTMTIAPRPGHSCRFWSHATLWMAVVALVSIRP